MPVQSFLDLYGDKPLRQVYEDWQPQPIDIRDTAWLNFPTEEFLSWARQFPRNQFDIISPAANQKKPTSFLLSQTHRIWLSAKLVVDSAGLGGSLVDFGAYPFSVLLALRDYFKYRGSITGTAIQLLASDHRAALDAYNIQLTLLDLDPYVVDRSRDHSEALPTALSAAPETVDVVTMFHVIEHLYHPMSSLKEAYRILRPGGRLIITTDNAMMLNTLSNYVAGYGYISEPVSSTCAMTVHDWRGHVRFFTASDLETMVAAAGFSTAEVRFEEVFYDVFHGDYFVDPTPYLPGFKRAILKGHRQFSNDLALVAIKR